MPELPHLVALLQECLGLLAGFEVPARELQDAEAPVGVAALVDHSHATFAQLGHLGVALFGQSGLDQILALVIVRRRHAARAGCVLKKLASGYEIIIMVTKC